MLKYKVLRWGMALLLIVCLCGCGNEDIVDEGMETIAVTSMESSVENTSEPVSASEASQGTEITPVPETPKPKVEIVIQEHEITMEEIAPMDMVADMRIGWNLGNTLDATGGIGLLSETSWGNPKTTKEMIDTIVDAGFNVIRIPVTWSNHFGPEPDYVIDETWLDRVQEVVDYAYEKDVYVILNMHHENWHFPSDKNRDQATNILISLWTQIGNRFRDYDGRLIFEGLNEPRKVGTAMEWNGGDYEGKQNVNHFAKIFVETVRATGGNNTIRNIMVTGYAASANKDTLRSLRWPKDDHVIVSVHAYLPNGFALDTKGSAVWDKEKGTKDIDELVKNLQEIFLDKGIPVIIGEFGALNKDNEAERVEWISYYLSKTEEIGVPCIWWDNGAFNGSGENFGLLNRYELSFVYPDLLKAMMDATEE